MRKCSKCEKKLDPRNRTGVCRECNPLTGAAGQAAQERAEKPANTSTLEVKGDAAEITRTTHEKVRSLADLIRICEIDTTEWEVERYVANKWEMGYKDKAQAAHTLPLFQIKAWLKRKVAVMDARAEIAALIEELALPTRKVPTIIRTRDEAPYMLEPSIPDLHMGKLAWKEETGHANYDSKIAATLYLKALDTLIARTASFKFERVVFPIGNDFFNADNLQNTTTRGTVQDADSRFQKSFRAGRRVAMEAIDRLRSIAPVVDIFIVPGNHDSLSSWFLGEVLDAIYQRTHGVTVHNQPTSRKYVEYGKNMILLTHGDTGKRQNYPQIMAAEQPQLWGRTLHKEAHTGHLHHLRVQEHHGVKVRMSPALCSADAWHANNQYVGNARGAEAFVFHREEGVVTVANYTVQEKQ